MVSASIQNLIPKLQACLETQPVVKAWMFGSCSRGEEGPDSDLDILVEYDKSHRISLMTISRIACTLKKAIGRDVDIVEEGHLKSFAVESANRDKILIYERNC